VKEFIPLGGCREPAGDERLALNTPSEGVPLKRYAIGALAALFLALPASSHAAVDVLQGDSGVPVVSFKTAKCKKNLRKGNGLKFA
jgi:hypothetical protein